MSTTIAGSPLPDKFSHIFFEVALQVLPEFNYDDLVYLSLLVRAQQREPLYFSLVDAIRKVQWMKLQPGGPGLSGRISKRPVGPWLQRRQS